MALSVRMGRKQVSLPFTNEAGPLLAAAAGDPEGTFSLHSTSDKALSPI